jgi:Hemoglobin-like flavoprotein
MKSETENGLPQPLTPEQIKLLRQSFGQVQSQGTIAALLFYRILFTIDPSLKSMFHTSIELQARKLMDSLAFTVNSLEEPGKLMPMLEAMGRRHVSYGVRDEHYETVLTALLQMLQESLGDAFTPDTRDAWETALNFVATAMKRGAADVPDPDREP